MPNRLLSALAVTGALFTLTHLSPADALREDFSSDPAARGWVRVGDTNLFRWNATNWNLDVTWDSSRQNSFFCHPISTALTRADDFSLAFDLRLSDIAVGANSNKPTTFQIAVGLVNLAQASDSTFLRGTGTDSPNVVELDYFPDSGFGATVSPTLISSNNDFATSFNWPMELKTGVVYQVAMIFTAAEQTLRTTMTSNGVPFGPIGNATLDARFSDFRVDHVAISSYSDAGQDPVYAGSVLAHGVVNNILLAVPPPVTFVSGGLAGNSWAVQFRSATNWLYTLERTVDFRSWVETGPAVPGNGGALALHDANPPSGRAFYRVRAALP